MEQNDAPKDIITQIFANVKKNKQNPLTLLAFCR